MPDSAYSAMGAEVRALVTGGAGFLGSHLCGHLLDRGWTVVCVDNEVTGSAANVAVLSASDRFRFVKQNVSERLDFDGPLDYVLHFASPANPPDYLTEKRCSPRCP